MTDSSWVPGVILAFLVFITFMILLCLVFLNWSLKRIDKVIDLQLTDLDRRRRPDGPFRTFGEDPPE